MHAAATHSSANRRALSDAACPDTATLPTRHAAPSATGSTMCQVFSPTRSLCRGSHHSATPVSSQGSTLMNPLVVLDTPNPLTTVGSQ